MSLIYAIIARGTDIVLVDFEAIPSNFPKLAKTLLAKIKANNRQTYLYNQRYQSTINSKLVIIFIISMNLTLPIYV